MSRIGVIASSFLKSLSDTFNRTTSGSLGNSSGGSTWSAIRGVWFANGSQGQSNDSASSYPLASIPFNVDAVVSVSVSEGTGAAFWVSDANNWWASVSYNSQSSYSCGCGTCYPSCATSACGCASYNSCANCSACGSTPNTCTSMACPGSYYSCDAGGVNICLQGTLCVNCDTNSVQYGATGHAATCTNGTACGTTCGTCTNSSCGCAAYNTCSSPSCGSGFSCGCSTCYTYTYYLRLLKSVSGTVSTVISDVSLGSQPAAIKVIIANGVITEYAYSDTAMTNQIGTATTTPSSPTTAPSVGIIKIPSASVQGSTVDNFSAS